MTPWVIDLFRLTRREYYADFFITPPLTAILAAISLRGASPMWPVLFTAGAIVWTLYEYSVHRWVLHKFWFFRETHFLHHVNQRDYIALHPAATVAIYVITWALFGFRSSAFMVGFSTGYIVYSILHTVFHFARITDRNWLFTLKRRHSIHHQFETVNYGVITSIWDRIFGTFQ